MTGRPRIAIVGAGNVGSASAAAIATRSIGDVHLYDIVEDLAAGKAMDINQAGAFFRSECRVIGCNSFDELAAADIVIITAGAPRSAGMKRKDLLRDNLDVLADVGEKITACCPQAKTLVVTNPADILTWLLHDQCPDLRLFGMGCTLDAVRFRCFLAEAAGVSVDTVGGMVIGSHDDNMVPLVRHATIGGVPVGQILGADDVDEVVRRTRSAGAEIVARLKTRGSFYTASYCIAAIIEAIVHDTRAVFPLSVHCGGAYGYEDACLALPCAMGAAGVESIIEMQLDGNEQAALDVCAAEIREGVRGVRSLL